MTAPLPDILAGMLAFFSPTPELRRVPEKEQGPHRSATPESTHMHPISIAAAAQGPLHFIREGFVTFTPAQAALVLRECRYERQRDETRAHAHIAALAEQMRRGLWLPKTQIDFARVGGRLVLVNGHHRMHAQVASAANVLWSVVFHDCADDAEVAALYWKFDTTVRKRSASNIISGIGLAKDTGLPEAWAAGLWASAQVIHCGMRFYFHERDGAALLPDQRVAICREYAAETAMVCKSAEKAILPVRRKLRTPSFLAPAIVVLRHNPLIGGEFIAGLCADDGLTKGDPRKTLLADMMVRNGRGASLYAANMMSFAIAWNAYYEQRPLKIIKVTGRPVPLAGTPYTVQS
jgi:hypothetical protein